MPSKRAKGKKNIAAWINQTTKDILTEKARIENKTLSDVIKEILEKEIQNGNVGRSKTKG